MLRRLPNIQPIVLIVVVYAILCVLLWLPTGWRTGLTADGWYFYMSAENHFFSISPVRPLVQLIHSITYTLFGDTLAGPNIMLAILLFARAMVVYVLLRQLRAARTWAFTAGALVLLLPIDTGMFYIGANAVYLSGIMALTAVSLMIALWRRPRPLTLFLMGLCTFVSVGIYEANLPVLLVAPLIFVLLGAEWNRRLRHVLLRWYLVPLIWIIYLLYTYLTVPNAFQYQASLATGFNISNMGSSLVTLYARHILFTWAAEMSSFPFSLTLFGISLAAAALVTVTLLWIVRREKKEIFPATALRTSSLRPRQLILTGLLLIGLAIAAYIPSSLLTSTLRTYWVSSAGAAIFFVGVLWFFSSVLNPKWGLAVVGMLISSAITIGTYRALEQHLDFAQQSERHQTIVQQFSALIPAVTHNTNILVYDSTDNESLINAMTGYWSFPYPFYIAYGLRVENFFTINVCGVSTTFVSEAQVLRGPQPSYCLLTPDYYEVWTLGSMVIRGRYSDLVMVEYSPDSGFQVMSDLTASLSQTISPADYNPNARLLPDATRVTERMARLFQ